MILNMHRIGYGEGKLVGIRHGVVFMVSWGWKKNQIMHIGILDILKWKEERIMLF